ncbi:MAG: SDR family NAD(P)-dependent oxidoreductase [Mycobacteriales bacterium]
MFDLSGRVALVTGATRDSGAGIARALAAQGAAVAVNGRRVGPAEVVCDGIRAAGGTAAPVLFDVTDREAVAAGVDRAADALGGPIDILVHNAGIADDMDIAPFLELDPARWRAPVEINLFGAMNCASAVLHGMCERCWGRFMQISSGSARVGSPVGLSLYGSAKSGVEGFIRHLSQEVGPFGVTANTLALGVQADAVGGPGVAEIIARIPTRRVGQPEDVGAAVVYLASDEASWMTGQTINLNGGSVTF